MKITIEEVLDYFRKPKHIVYLVVILVALIGVIYSVYAIFIYSGFCEDEACFAEKLVECDRSSYIKNNPETILRYDIKGKQGKDCEVNVEMLQVKQGSAELELLQGEEMICYLPLGVYEAPEKNLKRCHGNLRENIQEILIQRMHSQIVENIGEISAEISEVL